MACAFSLSVGRMVWKVVKRGCCGRAMAETGNVEGAHLFWGESVATPATIGGGIVTSGRFVDGTLGGEPDGWDFLSGEGSTGPAGGGAKFKGPPAGVLCIGRRGASAGEGAFKGEDRR